MLKEVGKRGSQLLLIALASYLAAWLYIIALWFDRLRFLRDLQILVAAGFLALWFLFPFRHRLGFRTGLAAGLIASVPSIAFTLVHASLERRGISTDGSLFGVLHPGTAPLIYFYHAFQTWGIDIQTIPYLAPPLTILLAGLGGALGRRC